MNIDKINALADVLCAKGLSAIEVGEGESRIRIEREIGGLAESAVTAALPITSDINTSGNYAKNDSALVEVKSPLVGVYYAAPSPDCDTFVSIGSKVNKGDVLCIIETMKLMNEITAEQDGEIVDICMKNGEIAEYGQVLFKMK
ncbi:MAG: acetyl-CoA carboxylase biotin carboxyl carrier protein subunit [Oscillospiraceae bacterium]|nr:acetyl-CoA carboxylase biotin carboxyl carrier protein subunit [Oscillospiraceae bacterium]